MTARPAASTLSSSTPSGEARVLAGGPPAERVRLAVAERAAALRERGIVPALTIVSVGDDPASAVYVRRKGEAAAAAGIACRHVRLPAAAAAAAVEGAIRDASGDPSVHGIILQLPLPRGLDAASLLAALDPAKDVDGLHPLSIGLLAAGRPSFVPATPLGVVVLLRHHGIEIARRRVTVIGRSVLVGRPLATLLSLRRTSLDATVTVCHSGTRDLARHTRDAEILIAAAGAPGTVTPEMVSPGATVVDVGTTRVPDLTRPGAFRLAGDVHPAVAAVAGALSPVPGGVGPMTVACLLANTVFAADPSGGRVAPVAEALA